MKERFKYLLKNFSFLLIGNFSSKILNFLLVPLYTSQLSTSEYGSYDIVYDTILLLIPILSLNISDALMRYIIDEERERQIGVINVAIKYTLIACGVFIFGIITIRLFFYNEIVNDYLVYIISLFMCIIIHQNIVQIARGLEEIKSISISGVIGTLVTVTVNVLFLAVLKYGLKGYFWANIIAYLVQIIFLICSAQIYKLTIKSKNKILEKEMILYSIPLMANTLCWNINSVADRYTVTFFEGVDANGIYAVSYKIPAVMTAVQTIFIQSWQLSAIKEFNSEEGKRFINKTYNIIQIMMIVLCSFTILFTRIMAKILFQADFYKAWICVPTLVFYVLFNTLSGTIGGVFAAAKDSKTFMNTAIIGATVNIVLNFFFVWKMGILGAAIATAVSSIVILGLRLRASEKYLEIEWINKKVLILFFLLLVQAVVMTSITSYYCYIIQVLIVAIIVGINWPEIKKCIAAVGGKHD